MSLKSHLSYFSALNNDINNTKQYLFKSRVGFRHTLLQVLLENNIMPQFLNPSQHLCLPAMDRLLRLIEHQTRDSSKCVEKGKALVHLSFRDLLYRKFLEFYGLIKYPLLSVLKPLK